MIKIAPSILSADFANLERDIRRVSSADWLHVDVMDGCFVPNLTIGVPVVQSIRKCTGMFLDVHLMIDKPVRYVEAFAQAGADLLSVHLEADHPTGIAEALRRMEACKVKKAVALRPITAPSAVLPYLEGLDMVLVMTVEPGFGGQAFLEHQLDTIRQVRALIERYNPACRLEVDGGISVKTAPAVVAAGADTLVAGSAVYGAAEPAAAIAALRGDCPMQCFPPALEQLVEQFARLPGIGRKTAQRLAFFVLSLPEEDAAAFADAIVGAKAAIHCCPVCQNFSEGDGLCPVCQDPKRDTSVICVVADPKDVVAMERSREYPGLYHVLHGVISPMNHVGPDDIRVKELVDRVAKGDVREVIMATNPDTEGEATAMYLSRLLKPFQVRVTRLAYGIPVGSHLEYADDATLMRALEGRREM